MVVLLEYISYSSVFTLLQNPVNKHTNTMEREQLLRIRVSSAAL